MLLTLSNPGVRDVVHRPTPPNKGSGPAPQGGPGAHVPLSDHDTGL